MPAVKPAPARQATDAAEAPARWLLLMHQLPPTPSYLRVKIWRRIQRLGAVAIKSSVYVLPQSDQAYEDLQWVLREIVAGGGDGTLCEARMLDGLTDAQVEALFHAARDADYAELVEAARELEGAIARAPAQPEGKNALHAELLRLRRGLDEITRLDFFGAPGRRTAESLLMQLESQLRGGVEAPARWSERDVRGRTWVTRRGIHVDRIASAWLIRRFIDAEARFAFVDGRTYRPTDGELRFDMFQAEFTHEGDLCTFEVLLARFGITDAGLEAIAEIVHDIDLKDAKYERPEAPGLAAQLAGLCQLHREDEARLARGSELFDELHAYYTSLQGRRRKR